MRIVENFTRPDKRCHCNQITCICKVYTLFQWELVCDRAYIAPLVTTVYFCGVMLGGVIFGGLSDRLGRKWVMLLCLYSQCLIGIGLHFVQRLPVFMGLRFVQGIAIQVIMLVSDWSTGLTLASHWSRVSSASPTA